MVCNGLYIHNFVNTDYNRNALLRKAEFPVEETLTNMIAIVSFTLNIIAIAAVMIFIIHTNKVHNRIYEIIDKMDRTIDDISIHLNIIKQNDDSIKKTHDKLNICINGITELISKLRYTNKTVDKIIYTVVERIADYNKMNEAKFSLLIERLDNIFTNKNKENVKPKTAKTKRISNNNTNTNKQIDNKVDNQQ